MKVMKWTLVVFFSEAGVKYKVENITKMLPVRIALAELMNETSAETLLAILKKVHSF